MKPAAGVVGPMLPLALGDGIGNAVAFTLLLALLLAACVLAAGAILVGYGLRRSTDATLGGTIAGALGVAAAVALGIDSWMAFAVVVGAGLAGFALVTAVRGTVRRSPFQHVLYDLVLAVLGAAGVLATLAFYAFLLGESVDVVDTVTSNPASGTLLVVLTVAPAIGGLYVLFSVGLLDRVRD